jgi:hypothetical protein
VGRAACARQGADACWCVRASVQLVATPELIWRKYRASRFVLDVLIIFPFEIFAPAYVSRPRTARPAAHLSPPLRLAVCPPPESRATPRPRRRADQRLRGPVARASAQALPSHSPLRAHASLRALATGESLAGCVRANTSDPAICPTHTSLFASRHGTSSSTQASARFSR